MNALTTEQEAILAECLQAMEQGQGLEACLSRFPHHAQALRPYLHLHAELSEIDVPEPSAARYQAGREELLTALASGQTSPAAAAAAMGGAGPGIGLASLVPAAREWLSRGLRVLRAPAVPGLAAIALVVLVGGGALGASAAAGFEPARAVLSSMGMMDAGDHGDGKHVDDGGKDGSPPGLPTKKPDNAETPASVIAPPKATPTEDKPDQPAPTDRPEATPVPTKRPENPKPSPTHVAVPTQQPDPTPIPIDLGDICIPADVYLQNAGLHAFDLKICSVEEVTYLKDTFINGLCLPKQVAEAYPSLVDLQVRPCLPKQEERIEQYLFIEGWCVPDKAAGLLAYVGSNIPPCTPYKIKIALLWLKDNDPCRIDWLVKPIDLVCG